MRPVFRQRAAAWVALGAMLASLALPAHATASRADAAGIGGDVCAGGKLVPAAPPAPGAVHACDACCASTPAAPAGERATSPVVAFDVLRILANAIVSLPAAAARYAPARAPPVI